MVPGLFVTRAGSEHLAGLAANAATLGSRGGDVLQIEALQEVLKKLKTKSIPIYEKKYGQVPMVRLWGHPLPMFFQEEIYHFEYYALTFYLRCC